MILRRSTHPSWHSNSYLVAAGPGGQALVIDAGAPAAPLIAAARDEHLRVSHVLLTHHHPDHVSERGAWVEAFDARVLIHAAERELLPGPADTVDDGQRLPIAGLDVLLMHVPGHTKGQLAVLVGGTHVFTGDTLFHGSVGGTRGPGHGTFAQLRASIMERLMSLAPTVEVHPGHAGPTTIGAEWHGNPFLRAWRGETAEGRTRCTVDGEPATLLVWAIDYDGGHKAWVRWKDGTEDTVPGSRVDFEGKP